MIIDARTLPDGTLVEADICIVGAGAAGITLANELVRKGISVALLESGGLDFDADVQALCEAEEKGVRADFDFARLRQFGGSTGHWGGNCAPFSPHELSPRAWVPDSGWPISAEEFGRYFQRAAAYCELGSSNYDAEAWARSSEEFRSVKLPLDAAALNHKVFLRSPPTRFGEVHRAALEEPGSPARVFLHAHVLEIETDADGRTVTGLRATDLAGHRHRFKAGTYVLAAGPENARLMLLSNRARPAGLGNGHDNVGRYFMGHPRIYTGQMILDAPPEVGLFYDAVRWRSEKTGRDVDFYVGVQPSPAVQEREGILNCTVFFEPHVEGKRDEGYGTLRQMARRLRRGEMPPQLAHDLGVVVGEVDRIGYVLYRRFAGGSGSGPVTVNLRWFCEQAPNRDSRLLLSSAVDPLGQRKLRLDWSASEIDMLTVIRMQELMAREFGRLGIGRLKAEFTSLDQPWPGANLQAHFMGGTRMHEDPRLGVVDPDCRVHGMANLFVTGGSVFPTSGSTMPTANMVALAIRLADHLMARS
ncbi:GMC oxidoreductase [Arenibaculum pallidiluteum]|uniref:GMC oxidoreductase n=1 Tax=Arenibaculum pallidiluteum TaxID=2812559 RepID=UPI001A95F2B0|nr:GMC family oxidoreductase [Arenibaculum pallidiluteum]